MREPPRYETAERLGLAPRSGFVQPLEPLGQADALRAAPSARGLPQTLGVMGTTEWFRNASWTDEVATQFDARLRRAKRKEQYLRIQASTLAHTEPKVAHALLDRYFALPDDFDHAQAHVDRASAFLAEGKLPEAIRAYGAALSREAIFKKLLTQAYVDFPYLVATRQVEAEYAHAVEVLDAHKSRLMFPVDHFKWNAAYAFISQALGRSAEARGFAHAALAAAAKDTSGFRHHPTVGLVTTSFAKAEAQLQRLRDA